MEGVSFLSSSGKGGGFANYKYAPSFISPSKFFFLTRPYLLPLVAPERPIYAIFTSNNC